MTQQPALSLSEYIAREITLLARFDAYYRKKHTENPVQWPLLKEVANWDEAYYQWSLHKDI